MLIPSSVTSAPFVEGIAATPNTSHKIQVIPFDYWAHYFFLEKSDLGSQPKIIVMDGKMWCKTSNI